VSRGSNAAILFEPSAYDANRKQVMGRHIAGASFLEGFVRHAEVDRYVGIGFKDSHAPAFRRQVASIVSGDPVLAARPVNVFNSRNLSSIASIGTLFVPDPQLASTAMTRRHLSQRGYSLCGITHTLSSTQAMEIVCEMLTGSVQSWDALICTSEAARKVVLRQQEHYADYLETRLGVRPVSPVQTPVIPLGVDADKFERLSRDGVARASLRQQIGADDHDTVVLFFGRLAYHAKAHPVPMYLGAQRVAQRLGSEHGRIHLVQTGQFPTKGAEEGYRDGAARYCPDVAVHFLDGADRSLADASWAAADVFISLSDNIQESFGITPVEAMAAGLPCLVSDWNGYKDTVVDGVTGLRVPTWMPSPGTGAAVADAHVLDNLSYDLYIGFVSQMTVVDVPAFADALEALVRDPNRRRQMGEAGRRRVRERYDWSVVVRTYQDLWSELAERRRVDTEIAPPRWQARNPRFTDPFDVFGAHASADLSGDVAVRIDPYGPAVTDLTAMSCNVFAANALLDGEETEALVNVIRDGDQTVESCVRAFESKRRVRVTRTLGWLAKYGVVSLGSRKGTEE
jgi:alpha-maltose-1-phosphate synthase